MMSNHNTNYCSNNNNNNNNNNGGGGSPATTTTATTTTTTTIKTIILLFAGLLLWGIISSSLEWETFIQKKTNNNNNNNMGTKLVNVEMKQQQQRTDCVKTTHHHNNNNDHHHDAHDDDVGGGFDRTTTTNSYSYSNAADVCQQLLLPVIGKSAAAIWTQYSDKIVQTAIHHHHHHPPHSDDNNDNDGDGNDDDSSAYHAVQDAAWLKDLFQALSPQRLSKALLVPPLTRDVETIMEIILRAKLLQNHETNSTTTAAAEPLRVGVFGGSVPEGRGCDWLPDDIIQSYSSAWNRNNNSTTPFLLNKNMVGRSCSWVHRLQLLADAVLGKGVVQIYNLAAGGTSSRLAIPTLEYWLYPSAIESTLLQAAGAPLHVIVNAYATNDALWSWSDNTTINNASASYQHYAMALQDAAAFGQAARQSQPCQQTQQQHHNRPPLVVFVGEYFGNHHERLLSENIRSDAVRQLAIHNGYTYISTAHAVRQYVYANTNETLFSPSWWNSKTGQRQREGHFGMPGHQFVAWTIAFSVLQAVVEYCEDNKRYHHSSSKSEQKDHISKTSSLLVDEKISDNIDTSERQPLLSTKTEELLESSSASPDLSWNTTPSNVSKSWQMNHELAVRNELDFCSSADQDVKPCIFAFVATQAGTHRRPKTLQNYLRNFEINNTGWKAENDPRNGWQNKLGLVAHQVNATVHYSFCNITNRIRYFTVHSLQSYGEGWEDSQAEFRLTFTTITTIPPSEEQEQQHQQEVRFGEHTMIIDGYHNMNNSLTYPHTLDLGKESSSIPIGANVTLRIRLVRGRKFKITAIFLCSR